MKIIWMFWMPWCVYNAITSIFLIQVYWFYFWRILVYGRGEKVDGAGRRKKPFCNYGNVIECNLRFWFKRQVTASVQTEYWWSKNIFKRKFECMTWIFQFIVNGFHEKYRSYFHSSTTHSDHRSIRIVWAN